MSNIANIAIVDGKPTPATHTFIPVQADPNAIYRTQQSSLPLSGQESVTLTMTLAPDRSAGMNRVKASLSVPVMEQTTGGNLDGYVAAPKVAYFVTCNAEFILPARSDAATRKDVRVMMSNLLLNAQVVDAVDNINKPY